MSTDLNTDDKEPTTANERPTLDMLDLNFVPAWARKPPTADPYQQAKDTAFEQPQRRERRRNERGPRDGRPPRRERSSEQRPGPRRNDRRADRQGDRQRPARGERRERDPARSQVREPLPPIQVAFIPEQERLATMINDVRASGHAFPLPELAHLFLSHPEWHAVKFESNKVSGGAYASFFYLSKRSGLVFLSETDAVKDARAEAIKQCFEIETVEGDAPSGNFVVVSRCRLSGELLGPPNHHAFTTQLEELHRKRFGHLTLDQYRREIETVRDPELIEQWKQAFRTKTVYRLKPQQEGDAPGEPLDAKQAAAYVDEHLLKGAVAKVHRAVLSGPLSRSITDPHILRLLRAAWTREQRFPATLIRALRGAFKRMGLHCFEAKGRAVFVTPIPPKPIDPARVISSISKELSWLQEHPGATRKELIDALSPSAGDDPERLAELLQPLTWLLEKGHVIEFHNGTLAVPQA